MKEFERSCDRIGLKTNVGNRKVSGVKKDQRGSCEKAKVSGEEMQEVNRFSYLGILISADVGMEDKVAHMTLKRKTL